MKVFVSGSKGFIGRNISKYLENKGVNVVHIDRNFQTLEIHETDVLIMCHAVVQSGTDESDDLQLFEGNVYYTSRLAKLFQSNLVIYFSTASIYEKGIEIIYENSEINPVNSYSLSKLWGEIKVKKYCKEFEIIRLSSVYGEGMKKGTLIPNFVDQAKSNNRITIFGNGNRMQNYIHISDVCKLTDKVLNQKSSNSILLCVSDKHYSNIDVANIISDFLPSEIVFVGEDNSCSVKYDANFTYNTKGWLPQKELNIGISEFILNNF